MATLVNTIVKGQTSEGYDQVSIMLHHLVKSAPGFIVHTAYGAEDGWHVLEVWQTKKEADEFFAKMVAPNLPHGIVPKRSYTDLHSIVLPDTKSVSPD